MLGSSIRFCSSITCVHDMLLTSSIHLGHWLSSIFWFEIFIKICSTSINYSNQNNVFICRKPSELAIKIDSTITIDWDNVSVTFFNGTMSTIVNENDHIFLVFLIDIILISIIRAFNLFSKSFKMLKNCCSWLIRNINNIFLLNTRFGSCQKFHDFISIVFNPRKRVFVFYFCIIWVRNNKCFILNCTFKIQIWNEVLRLCNVSSKLLDKFRWCLIRYFVLLSFFVGLADLGKTKTSNLSWIEWPGVHICVVLWFQVIFSDFFSNLYLILFVNFSLENICSVSCFNIFA